MQAVTANDDGTKTVWHGGYGYRTRFDIAQHRYGCTDCEDDVQAFQELLEIRDPPPGRAAFVIHMLRHDVGSRIWEFAARQDAEDGWKALSAFNWSDFKERQFLPLINAIHADFPGTALPWFYEAA